MRCRACLFPVGGGRQREAEGRGDGGDSEETKHSAAINGDIFHVTLKVNTPSERQGHMGSFRVGGNKKVSRWLDLTAG